MANYIMNNTVYTGDKMFYFEENFNNDAVVSWIREYRWLSLWFSLVYVILVFSGRRYMSTRPKFELRAPLAVWSGTLAIFSIVGAARTIPEMIFMLKVHGFEGSVCDPSCYDGTTGVWVSLMTISKLFELGDTAFIVLRKQPLMFLHWYHHITVFIYGWYAYSEYTAPVRWFVVMNFTVHAFMYTYYALRAIKVRFPKVVNICITSLQILQMIMGIVVLTKAYQYRSQGHFCQQSWDNMCYCAVMYTSYLLLFVQFFYNAYLKPKASTATGKYTKDIGLSTAVNGNTSLLNNSNISNGSSKKID